MEQNNSEFNAKLEEILKKPKKYWEMIQVFPFSLLKTKEKINYIRNSDLEEELKEFSDDEIITFIEKVTKKIEKVRKWLINSKIRASTFYYLGSNEAITSTEIGKLISKHPKSVSNYIFEFKDKGWINEPEKVGREKKYSLSEQGFSFFYIAKKMGWFKKIIIEEPTISETIIKVAYFDLISEKHYHALNPVSIQDRSKMPEPDFYELGEDYYFVILPHETWPSLQELIIKILTIGKVLLKELNLDKNIPKINIVERNLISINSQDLDDLALIFASFNYMEKNKIKNRNYWSMGCIKVISPDLYFNLDMPDVHDDKGFMTIKETEKFIRNIMKNFKDKLNK